MKAVRVHEFGPPSAMCVEDVDVPTPGPRQILVRVRAAGVNPVDTLIRTGTYAHKPPLPYTPGVDGAGIVEAVGPAVTGVTAGDRVYLGGTSMGVSVGTYAEFALCDRPQVHRLPPHVTFAQGATVNVPYVTAYRALFQRAEAQPGETVLVHGASGGVGVAAVQMARAHGMRVVGTAGTERGQRLAREQGAHDVLNHAAPNYLDELPRVTEQRGVDVVLEMAAHLNLAKDLEILAPGGRVVVIGNRGPIEINMRPAMGRDASIMGVLIWNIPAPALQSIHAALEAGLEAGTLRPFVGQELPLAEAPRAHEAILQPGAYGKITLVP